MKKINNKGFALVETLIVSVFVLGIFTLIYTNFYPLIGEYEKRENYDAIESVYKTNVIKRFIEYNNIKFNITTTNPVIIFQSSESFCNSSSMVGSQKTNCQLLMNKLRVSEILVATYDITNVKYKIDNNNNCSEGMESYVKSLPNYKNNLYNIKGRIIVKYKETVDEESSEGKYDVYKYATLGVDLYD